MFLVQYRYRYRHWAEVGMFSNVISWRTSSCRLTSGVRGCNNVKMHGACCLRRSVHSTLPKLLRKKAYGMKLPSSHCHRNRSPLKPKQIICQQLLTLQASLVGMPWRSWASTEFLLHTKSWRNRICGQAMALVLPALMALCPLIWLICVPLKMRYLRRGRNLLQASDWTQTGCLMQIVRSTPAHVGHHMGVVLGPSTRLWQTSWCMDWPVIFQKVLGLSKANILGCFGTFLDLSRWFVCPSRLKT